MTEVRVGSMVRFVKGGLTQFRVVNARVRREVALERQDPWALPWWVDESEVMEVEQPAPPGFWVTCEREVMHAKDLHQPGGAQTCCSCALATLHIGQHTCRHGVRRV